MERIGLATGGWVLATTEGFEWSLYVFQARSLFVCLSRQPFTFTVHQSSRTRTTHCISLINRITRNTRILSTPTSRQMYSGTICFSSVIYSFTLLACVCARVCVCLISNRVTCSGIIDSVNGWIKRYQLPPCLNELCMHLCRCICIYVCICVLMFAFMYLCIM